MSKWQFTKEEVTPLFQDYSYLINNGMLKGISPDIAPRVKASKVVTGHGTDTRVLQYHLWVTGQVFDKKYFKYEIQHDPVPRYTGSATTNWAIQFWMNKVRGVYFEREVVVPRVRKEVSSIKVKGFSFEENKQGISLIKRFPATSLIEVKKQIDASLFRLINSIHPMFCSIVDVFGLEISKEERRRIIDGGNIPTSLNRISSAFGSAPEYNRNVPKKLRFEVFERDDYTCSHCKTVWPATDLHADHVIPASKGGLTILKNLQTLCAACNLKKGGKFETTFMRAIN